MEYLTLKNSRIQGQIQDEREKIKQEKGKYNHYVEELKNKLDEAEKETRLAQVLHKTYVDQIEREKEKLS